MESAITADIVRRTRRVWLYAPTVDAGRLAAVRVGGRLSCVSAAKRLGLWVPSAGGIHIALPRHASRVDAGAHTLHWSQGPVPADSRASQEPLINVLFHVASCLPRDDALAVWESAVRRSELEASMLSRVKWRSTASNELAAAASTLADSGLETHVFVRLTRLGLAVRRQVELDGHEVDLLIGDRLAMQLDGKHHLEAKQRRRDIRGDARLALMGYTVLRFDYQQVMFNWPEVEATVLAAVAQGLHRAA